MAKHILQCQCKYCGAAIAYPFKVKGVLLAVRRGKLDPATLSIHFAHHDMVGQQAGIFSFQAILT